MRVTMTKEAETLITNLKEEHKEKKLPQSAWSEVISKAVLSQTSEFWEEQIKSKTPDTVLLKKAIKDPRMQRELIEMLRSRDLL